ncbi:MAG: potassium-transporting ATPase subunit B, partial [Christensenellaceae bacterium]
MKQKSKSIMGDALVQSVKKLSPRVQIKNPVMFVVYIGAIFVTILYILGFAGLREAAPWYVLTIALILWFTVLFANVAEAIAEGRGRAQADSLKKARRDVPAKKLKLAEENAPCEEVFSNDLC